MLRKVLAEEGLKLVRNNRQTTFEDEKPQYDCQLQQDGDLKELFLGNRYEENVECFDVLYWNDVYCDEDFLRFVEEIKVFEEFVNDYFMGIDMSLCFNVSAQTLPVRLSDEMCYNYLNYNTNL